MRLSNLALIILTSILTATGNLLLRKGVSRIELLFGTSEQTLRSVRQLVFTPTFMLGVVSYLIATALWVYVLSRQPIGLSYPIFVACAFLFVTLGATLLLGESLTTNKLIGMGLMLAGIVYVSIAR